MKITDTLVQRLVSTQFPQWKNLPVRPVAFSGWDNRTFHLGKQMLVRMPSAAEYALQVEKEHQWLPKLAPFLLLSIPKPLAMGEPAEGYPWEWSIYQWLEGESATPSNIVDLSNFASRLAKFLIALQRIDTTDGPRPGPHSFYRGGTLAIYDAEVREAITLLKGKIDVEAVNEVWEVALATSWSNPPVWVHGDVSAGNLLVQEGELTAVIDFGQLTVGDPACDLAIAWTLFSGKNREAFREMLALDAGTWARARGWTLWKALMYIVTDLTHMNFEAKRSWQIIDEVVADHL